VENMGIDETSYQKRHEYVTVLLDKDHGKVLGILDDRKAETLKTWLLTQEIADLRFPWICWIHLAGNPYFFS